MTPELVLQRHTTALKRDEAQRLRLLIEEQKRAVAELQNHLSKSHDKAKTIMTKAINAAVKANTAENMLPMTED